MVTIGPVGELEALAAAEILILPSRLESRSLVLLEAWSVATPAPVHGECSVTRGQCLRSGGGLYYRSFRELAEVPGTVLERPDLARRLGEGGRRYLERHDRWATVEARLLAFLDSCGHHAMGRHTLIHADDR